MLPTVCHVAHASFLFVNSSGKTVWLQQMAAVFVVRLLSHSVPLLVQTLIAVPQQTTTKNPQLPLCLCFRTRACVETKTGAPNNSGTRVESMREKTNIALK